MGVTRIDIDEDALECAMALSGAKIKKEAVNLALRFYAEKQERAARIARHFERASHWGALEGAERLHRAENGRRGDWFLPPAADRVLVFGQGCGRVRGDH